MTNILIAGKHFPKGGCKKFDGKKYRLNCVHRRKRTAIKAKEKFKKKGKLVRIIKGSGGFPYHLYLR